MENIMNNPVIGVVMCRNRLKGHATQTLQKVPECHHPRRRLANCTTHMRWRNRRYFEQLLPKLDGVSLPGSPSNVQPHLYGENGDEPDADPGRDLLEHWRW